MNFLDFLENKKNNDANKQIISEGFKNSELGKAQKLIIDLLKKETKEVVVSLGNFDLDIDGSECTSELFVISSNKNPICFTLNWLNSGKSSQVYSISFFKNMNVFFDGQGKSDLTIETYGCSIVYFIPIISYVISTGDLNLEKNDATKFIKSLFSKNIKEAKQYSFYIGALKYIIHEGLKESIVRNTFLYNIEHHVFEGSYADLLQWQKDKYGELKDADNNKGNSAEDKERYLKLSQEYEEISKAIKGGASSIEEVKLAIQKNVTVKIHSSEAEMKAEKEFEKSKKDPDQVFKEMEKYVKMVMKGITPSVILCGAPGVGKSYRVKKLLKENGYNEGQNLCTIKGKCTPRILYLQLVEYKKKGDIIVIDDADGLVGPKAPEEVINLLKAALDSTSDEKGRLVKYGIAGPLKDDEGMEVSKTCYFNGGVIVITNYNAGQLDTALRGRSFIQDIHFSTEDVLNIIKKIMPNLDPEHLSAGAKTKAFDYLQELANNKSKMEISIRTFGICAKIFEACDNDSDFTDDDAKSMIAEQMKLQAARGGNKY